MLFHLYGDLGLSKWLCQSQNNPRCTASDGVPPEAADLGFHRLPVELGLPESEVGLTDFAADSPRGYSKVVRSSAICCVGHKQRQHNFGDAAVEEYFGYLKTEFF